MARLERDRAERGHAAGVPERYAVEPVHDRAAVLRAEGGSSARLIRSQRLAVWYGLQNNLLRC